MPKIRNYQPSDETTWLRCRVLAFLNTCYYDDVWTSRPPEPPIQLVATDDGNNVIGLIDVALDASLATIDTIAVHPDHQHEGIGTALLDAAEQQLPAHIETVDAWTREDVDTLAWYRSRGFAESDRYLHVYKGWNEPALEGWAAPAPLTAPLAAYCQSTLEHEAELRASYKRVYVCRRFSRSHAVAM